MSTPRYALDPAHLARIPRPMKDLPQWVCAELRPDPATGKTDKLPRDPKTGRLASVTDPATWADFATAIAAARRKGWALGFVLTREAGIVVADADGCIDPVYGTVAEPVLDAVAALASYTEVSQSGRGVHVFAYGALPPGRRRGGGWELYDADRFVVVTGRPLCGGACGGDDLADAGPALAALHARLFGADGIATEEARTPVPPELAADDEEIVRRLRTMAKGARLYDEGDFGDYPSESEADGGLACLLVVAGAADEDQVERIFEASAFYTRKDEKHRRKWARADYRRRTIESAFARVRPFDGWGKRPEPAPVQRETVDDVRGFDTAEIGVVVRKPQDARTGGQADEAAALKAEIRRLTAELEAERSARRDLERRLAMLSEVQSRTAGIVRNKALGQARPVGIAALHFLANKTAADAFEADGMVPAPAAVIAEAAGCSDDTASKHLENLAKVVPIRREVRWIPERFDPATRSVTGGHKLTYLGLAEGATVGDLAAALAAAAPPPDPNKKGWGGDRTRCPDHPEAGTVKTWSVHCAACDRLLDRGEEVIAPADAPEIREAIGKPHLAGTDSAPDLEPPPGVVTTYSSRPDPTSHNGNPTDRDGRIARARADLAARRAASPPRLEPEPPEPPEPEQPAGLPGFEPPPADRWTDPLAARAG